MSNQLVVIPIGYSLLLPEWTGAVTAWDGLGWDLADELSTLHANAEDKTSSYWAIKELLEVHGFEGTRLPVAEIGDWYVIEEGDSALAGIYNLKDEVREAYVVARTGDDEVSLLPMGAEPGAEPIVVTLESLQSDFEIFDPEGDRHRDDIEVDDVPTLESTGDGGTPEGGATRNGGEGGGETKA